MLKHQLTFLTFLQALRPNQWVKGVFIVLPLVFGGQLFNPFAVGKVAVMVLLFSLASSAVYLVNDTFDIEEDKHHPEKKKRLLASGRISTRQAYSLSGMLAGLSLGGSFLFIPQAGFIIAIYLLLNYFYSSYLKKIVIIDVFCIGFFYYLRIGAGGVASGVMLSNWIIMCTVLLALFLGFNKRKHDLVYNSTRSTALTYDQSFLDRMISIIAASLIMSYALYVMDKETIAKFGTSALVYSVPFVYYGIFRYIYLLDSRVWGGDPVRILLNDKAMLATVVSWVLACIVIIYFF